jgi:N-acetylmuramoyl-L-alanine amidase
MIRGRKSGLQVEWPATSAVPGGPVGRSVVAAVIARTRTILAVVCAVCLGISQPAMAQTETRPSVIQSIAVQDLKGAETEVVISADGPFRAAPFELLSPPRMVIDIPNVGFAMRKSPPELPGRLVKRYRFGELQPGQGRIVLDTRTRAKIVRRSMSSDGGRHELRLLLSSRGGARQAAVPLPRLRPSTFSPRERREYQRTKTPVIVIDPGHGGADPGALTAGGVAEKTIALAVARRLAARLRKSKKYNVIMTRSTDKFVSLDDRVRISEEAEADLFISLHADAVGDQAIAAAVSGATVYTVSDRASDEVAQALADKENAADQRGGIKIGQAEQSEAVRTILFDLLRRESTDRAARFREHLIRKLGRAIALSRSPKRSAAFKVLKQVQTPAVLIELGYMSNIKDQALMQTPEWQAKVARAMSRAVDLQFSRR